MRVLPTLRRPSPRRRGESLYASRSAGAARRGSVLGARERAGRTGRGAAASGRRRTRTGWPRRSGRTARPTWTGPLAVLLVLLGVFATGAGLGRVGGWSLVPLGSGNRPPPRDFPVLEPSRPVRLEIPAIGVRAPVQRVGLASDGSIAVPALAKHNEAGWYDGGPTPGQFGPAIIVGHVDTRSGPSVFHDLTKLRPGARIRVARVDRSVAIFEVNSVEHFDKAKLPAERVYGDYARPGLRLITCGGEWVGGGIGYADNVVAFASLVDSRRS